LCTRADSAPAPAFARVPSDVPGGLHPPDSVGRFRRKPDVLNLAAPDPMAAVQQVFAIKRFVIASAPLPERNLEVRFLSVVRIQADGDQNAVFLPRRCLAEVQNVVVEGIVEG